MVRYFFKTASTLRSPFALHVSFNAVSESKLTANTTPVMYRYVILEISLDTVIYYYNSSVVFGFIMGRLLTSLFILTVNCHDTQNIFSPNSSVLTLPPPPTPTFIWFWSIILSHLFLVILRMDMCETPYLLPLFHFSSIVPNSSPLLSNSPFSFSSGILDNSAYSLSMKSMRMYCWDPYSCLFAGTTSWKSMNIPI